jgi:polyferredoxin
MNRLAIALLVVTAQAEDGLTSIIGLQRGYIERNPLGSSVDRLILMKLAAIMLILGVVWIAWALPSPTYRVVATAALIGSAFTFMLAAHNASL